MSDEPELLFDGPFLQAAVFWPATPNGRLIVTFRHRVPDAGVHDAPKPRLRFLNAGWTHLHIQTRFNDWYVNTDTAGLCTILGPFAAAFGYCAGIGFSMGGYGALRFSGALGMHEVVAVSPQVSIAPQVVPYDSRFRGEAAGFDAVLGDLATHVNPALKGVVIFDPFRQPDRLNAAQIADILPGVALCRYGFGGHPATGVLRETVTFAALQSLVLNRRLTRARVLSLHRNNRAAAPSWWFALARHAELTGRFALAATALKRGRSIRQSLTQG